jgi:putative restriction endonuclease
LSKLNEIDTLTDAEVAKIENHERRIVVARIKRRYRSTDFQRRVLGAYNYRCSMCGLQLELVEAAHIIPVPIPTSTDETKNGIALCKLHHAAYDRNLISFDKDYRIEVSETEAKRLTESDKAHGLRKFREALRPALILPNDRRDYPPSIYIQEARKVRGWTE